MRADANAKVNLSLRVQPPDRSGKHPLRSLAQSIDWADRLTLEDADDDSFAVTGADVPTGEDNLAWRALEAIRVTAHDPHPVVLTLHKNIPVAAGLGGGSADAAVTLVLAADRFGLDDHRRDALGPEIGADVHFCLLGGTAWMEGYGERLTPERGSDDYSLAVVVPPFESSTAAIYQRWDDLGGPQGAGVAGRGLPVSLRVHAPLVNDLVPAAIDLAPEIADWAADLRRLWGGPVLMSGSGPALFGFFADELEAEEAAGAVQGARAAGTARPTAVGWRLNPSGTMA
jgi:4-diphosphocytidyl-2-C-methyl-D-erythritol kinase